MRLYGGGHMEVEALASITHDARQGRGRVLVIDGPAGIGKTRLLDELRLLAQRAGLSVGYAAANELAELAPLGCFLDLLRESNPPILTWDVLAESVGVPDARAIVLEQLRGVLERHALVNPVLRMLDDLHWADQGTLLAVRVLGRQLSSSPIIWALTGRPYPATPALDR